METIGIIALTVVAPIWIVFHYITQWKKNKSFSAQDEVDLTEIRNAAERLEDRIRVMERILDDEVPDWKDRK